MNTESAFSPDFPMYTAAAKKASPLPGTAIL
jgi:hypothetical protein